MKKAPGSTLALLVTMESRNTHADDRRMLISARVVRLNGEEIEDLSTYDSGEDDLRYGGLRQDLRLWSDSPDYLQTTLEYADVHSVSWERAIAMAETFKKIDRTLLKIGSTDGTAESPGEVILRFAKVLGASAVFFPATDEWREVTGQIARRFLPADARHHINMKVWEFRQDIAKDKAAA